MTTGKNVLVVPAGFAGSSGHGMDEEAIVLADPRETVDTLTNPNDRPVIASLTGVAERSTAFSCWRVFVKNSTQSVTWGCLANVCCCCQHCQSTVEKVLPVGATIAPAQQAMQR